MILFVLLFITTHLTAMDLSNQLNSISVTDEDRSSLFQISSIPEDILELLINNETIRDLCGKMCQNQSAPISHGSMHSNSNVRIKNTLPCPFACGAVLIGKTRLEKHIRINHGETDGFIDFEIKNKK